MREDREDILAVPLPTHDEIFAWFPHQLILAPRDQPVFDRTYIVFFHAQLPSSETILFLGQWPVTLPAAYIAWVITWMLNMSPENHPLLWVSTIHTQRAPENSSFYIAVTSDVATSLLQYTHRVRFFPTDDQTELILHMALTSDAKEFLNRYRKRSIAPLPNASLSFEIPQKKNNFPSYAYFFNASPPATGHYIFPANNLFVNLMIENLNKLIDKTSDQSNKNFGVIGDQLFSMQCQEPWDDDPCAKLQAYSDFMIAFGQIVETFHRDQNIDALRANLRALRDQVTIEDYEVSMHSSSSPR